MKILEKNREIVKVLFFLNTLASIVSFFFFDKRIIFILLGINVLLLGTSMIIQKYSLMFEGIIKANSFARKLNERLS